MSHRNVIDELQDAINAHDPDRIASCFTPSYKCERPLHPEESFEGSAQVRGSWALIVSRLPDLRATILRRAEGAGELWSEWEMAGTDSTGSPVVLRGPVILTTHNGRIDWARFYIDPVAASPGTGPRR